MLSEETAKGQYPVESVLMLSKIAGEIDPGLKVKIFTELCAYPTTPYNSRCDKHCHVSGGK